jgi:hypothetical protein
MYLIETKIKKKYVNLVKENFKQAKQHYLDTRKVPEDIFRKLAEIDPTPTKKYLQWMCKIWFNEKKSLVIHELASKISEYNAFVERGTAITPDIYQFKTYKDLATEVDYLNNTGAGKSKKQLKQEIEVVRDDEDLYVVRPLNHQACYKLGQTDFNYRGGNLGSNWCITYKNDTHFNSYYFKNLSTFYLIKVKNPVKIKEVIEKYGKQFIQVAYQVFPENSGRENLLWDATDKSHRNEEFIDEYFKFIGM